MAEYIELTEELILSMRAGARAISNTKKYHGTIYVSDVFSENPKEMPYLKAAEILYAASEEKPADVAPVRHAKVIDKIFDDHETIIQPWDYRYYCSACKIPMRDSWNKYCPNCGAKMDL